MKKILKWIISRLGERAFNRVGYYYLHLKLGVPVGGLSMGAPAKFNEKIIWLKMHYRHPNAACLADKVAVKDYVGNMVGCKYIIPTLQVCLHPDDVNYDALPDAFVVKPNHASGWCVIVNDKNSIDKGEIRRCALDWLGCDYSLVGHEYQYRGIAPKLLIETLLKPRSGQLIDYKFFCFDGVPKFVQLDFDRFTNHTRNFYDLDWKRLPFSLLYPSYGDDVPRPSRLNEMVDVACKLSTGFPFIRVDLYECEGYVYFGELTFHPEGGFGPICPSEWDLKLGHLLQLPPADV